MWRHVVTVATFVNLNDLSWQRPFALSIDCWKRWARVFFFLSEIYNYCQHPGLLWSVNFATTVTWRNDFSSLFKASRLSKIIVFFKQRNKLLKWCNVGVVHRCTFSLKSHYVGSYGLAWPPISDVIRSTGGNLIDWKSI